MNNLKDFVKIGELVGDIVRLDITDSTKSNRDFIDNFLRSYKNGMVIKSEQYNSLYLLTFCWWLKKKYNKLTLNDIYVKVGDSGFLGKRILRTKDGDYGCAIHFYLKKDDLNNNYLFLFKDITDEEL